MGNPLHNIFTQDEPQFKGTLSFDSEDAAQNFWKALKKCNENEQAVEIDGVKGVTTFCESGGLTYQIDREQGNIANFFVFPFYEHIPFRVETEYGQYDFNFKRIKKENEIVIKTDINSVVYIEIKIDLDNNSSKCIISYKLNPTKAEDIDTIIRSYNAFQKFIQISFKQSSYDKTPSFMCETLSLLKDFEAFWKRVREVEKITGIYFNPMNITDSKKDRISVNELYFLLVKKMHIRKEINDITITTEYDHSLSTEKLNVGLKLAFSFIEEMEYEIFSSKITINILNYIFNAVVGSIDENQDSNECKIKYIGTELQPLHVIYLGYLLEDNIPKVSDFNEAYKKYSNAKTLEEILNEVFI